jgi:hypothetical protein
MCPYLNGIKDEDKVVNIKCSYCNIRTNKGSI